MSTLHHQCGVAAVYHLPGDASPLCPEQGPAEVSRLIPRMLLDIQNRGQLSAGITSYSPDRKLLLDTHKDLGSVHEVFRMSHRGEFEHLMRRYAGCAAIGHVRYATCGPEDRSYAQPFERHHLQKHKWFAFAFNGQLANYASLRAELLADGDNYLARETDTEILRHLLSHQMSGDRRPTLVEMIRNVNRRLDGAYALVYLDALGNMLVARDPLGNKPLCYAREGELVAAASESVALVNLGFAARSVRSLPPGHAITIVGGELSIEQFAEPGSDSNTPLFASLSAQPAAHEAPVVPGSESDAFRPQHKAHCFFEWIYFANVASTLDGRSVYLSRTALGEELARLETLDIDDQTIVVPVPDTSKAAADAMAYKLGVPSREGLIRNRYAGRTFIEGSSSRKDKARTKYTPLPEVLAGKRVILVEDSIVRSTTMKVLLERIRHQGRAREIHVRVACPPIIAPCFYGIDMSTVHELFAPRFLRGGPLTPEVQQEMAAALGADSLRYLPVESIARAIGFPGDELCQACITGRYPTPCGQQLYQIALHNGDAASGRTYEQEPPALVR